MENNEMYGKEQMNGNETEKVNSYENNVNNNVDTNNANASFAQENRQSQPYGYSKAQGTYNGEKPVTNSDSGNYGGIYSSYQTSNAGASENQNDHLNTSNNTFQGNEYTRTQGNPFATNKEQNSAYTNGNTSQQNNPFGGYGSYVQSVEEEKKQAKADHKMKKAKKTKEKKEKAPKSGAAYVCKKAVGIGMAGILFGGLAAGSFIGVNYLAGNTFGNSNNTSTVNSTTLQEKANAELTTSDGSSQKTVVSTNTTSQDGMSISEIAEAGMKSIVAITNKGATEVQTMWGNFKQESESTGSGIIIGKTDTELLIVTNYHVVSGSNELSVVFSYDENTDNPNILSAKIKGYDESRDLAVIAVDINSLTDEILSEISIAVIGDSNNLVLGEQVVAIGNALGYGQSVTVGYVSALDRSVELENEDGTITSNTYIQTDAAINPGNSGGALFNLKGELIGINSAKVASSSVEGMGYAIPISDVTDIISELMNTQTRDVVEDDNRGYLGITGQTVSSDVSDAYGIPQGAYVKSVTDGSAADLGGIKAGDIIVKFDGKTIASFDKLQEVIRYYQAGETVKVVVMRQAAGGYEEVNLEVSLSSASEVGATTSSTQNQSAEDKQNSGNDSQGGYNYGNGINPFSYFFGNF